MNNKGFAITTILFGILVLFSLLMLSLFGMLATYKQNLQKLIENTNGARDKVTSVFQKVETYNYSEDDDYFIYKVPKAGYYRIEAAGAQGGDAINGAIGGRGAYTSGYIYLEEDEKLYLYIGKAGTTTYNAIDGHHNYGSGGETTDIRYFGSYTPTAADLEKNSLKGLNARIMVAAGGGGAYYYNYPSASHYGSGGNGGTLIGTFGSSSDDIERAAGGTQVSGGTGANEFGHSANGEFGIGGAYNGSTGGNGYYGGGGTSAGGGDYALSGAGGGSSFISGYAGVNARSAIDSEEHTNNTLHYSGKYFVNARMSAGINSGDGLVKITYFGNSEPTRVNTKLNNVKFVKDCLKNTNNHWIEIQAISAGNNVAYGKNVTITNSCSVDPVWGTQETATIVDGSITDGTKGTNQYYATVQTTEECCITVNLGSVYNLDEVSVWHFFADNRTYNGAVTYVSANGSEWTEIIKRTAAEDANGKRVSAWYD